MNELQILFPSPIGESYFSIMKKEKIENIYYDKFPSPIGESYFSIIPEKR